jgi:hypothetical protein
MLNASLLPHPVHPVHGRGKRGEETPALFGCRADVGRRQEQRDVALFQHPESGDDPLETRTHFMQRRLLVVERVQQSEDHHHRRLPCLDEGGETVGDHGFHLEAGERPGDVDVPEKLLRAPPQGGGLTLRQAPRELGKIIDVEPVRAVDQRHRNAGRQPPRGNVERQPEDGAAAVQAEEFSGRRRPEPVEHLGIRHQGGSGRHRCGPFSLHRPSAWVIPQ